MSHKDFHKIFSFGLFQSFLWNEKVLIETCRDKSHAEKDRINGLPHWQKRNLRKFNAMT